MPGRPPAKRDNLTLSYWNPNWDEWEDTRSVTATEFDEIVKAEGYVKADEFYSLAEEYGWVRVQPEGEGS